MKYPKKHYAKRYSILCALVFMPLTLLYFMTYQYYTSKEPSLIQAAEKVCNQSPFLDGKEVQIINIVHKQPFHPHCTMLFTAQYTGKDAFLFAIPLNGIYGIYSGLFLYEKTTGAVFCGLLGIKNAVKNTGYYGITPVIIDIHKKKIEALMGDEKK